MTAGSNVDLEPESDDDDEVVPAVGGKDAEPTAEERAEPESEPAERSAEAAERALDEPMLEPTGPAGAALGDAFLDGPLTSSDNGNLRAELTSADAMTIETDEAPVSLLVAPDAPDGITQEAMEIEYDDDVLQIGQALRRDSNGNRQTHKAKAILRIPGSIPITLSRFVPAT